MAQKMKVNQIWPQPHWKLSSRRRYVNQTAATPPMRKKIRSHAVSSAVRAVPVTGTLTAGLAMTKIILEPVPDTVGAVLRTDTQCDPPENRVVSPAEG